MDNISAHYSARGLLPFVYNCPICRSKSTQVNTLFILGLVDCATYHCEKCGVYFRRLLPKKEAVSRYYLSRYFRYPDNIERAMAQKQGGWIFETLRQNDINLNSVRYIEFGAGRGWLVSFIQNHGSFASVVGYEPDKTSVQWGREHFHIDLREGFLPDVLEGEDICVESVAFLSLVHVLEHLHMPEDVLKSLQTRFRDSYIFIEVPDAEREGLVMTLDTFPWSSMGQHFWSFTEQSLRILLQKSGFEIVTCTKDGEPGFWDSNLQKLRIWKAISDYYHNCYQNGFNIKQGLLSFLKMACMCLSTGIKFFLRRLFGKTYNRIDLPVIRLLAKTIPEGKK